LPVAAVLLAAYLLVTFLNLRRHAASPRARPGEDAWSLRTPVIALAVATTATALVSEILVRSPAAFPPPPPPPHLFAPPPPPHVPPCRRAGGAERDRPPRPPAPRRRDRGLVAVPGRGVRHARGRIAVVLHRQRAATLLPPRRARGDARRRPRCRGRGRGRSL